MKNNIKRDDLIVASIKSGAKRSNSTAKASLVRKGATSSRRQEQEVPRKGPSAAAIGFLISKAVRGETPSGRSDKKAMNAAPTTTLKEELANLPAAVRRVVIGGLDCWGNEIADTVSGLEVLHEDLAITVREAKIEIAASVKEELQGYVTGQRNELDATVGKLGGLNEKLATVLKEAMARLPAAIAQEVKGAVVVQCNDLHKRIADGWKAHSDAMALDNRRLRFQIRFLGSASLLTMIGGFALLILTRR